MICTFVMMVEIERGVVRFWMVLVGLGVLLVLLGLVVVDWLVRSLVWSIVVLFDVSHRLASAELTARAESDGLFELREVVGGFNHLVGCI